jgi:hypothetical protein
MLAAHSSSLGSKVAQNASGVTHDNLDVGFAHDARSGIGGDSFLEHPAHGLKAVVHDFFDFRDGPVDHGAIEFAPHKIAVGSVGRFVLRDGLAGHSEGLIEGGVEAGQLVGESDVKKIEADTGKGVS